MREPGEKSPQVSVDVDSATCLQLSECLHHRVCVARLAACAECSPTATPHVQQSVDKRFGWWGGLGPVFGRLAVVKATCSGAFCRVVLGAPTTHDAKWFISSSLKKQC